MNQKEINEVLKVVSEYTGWNIPNVDSLPSVDKGVSCSIMKFKDFSFVIFDSPFNLLFKKGEEYGAVHGRTAQMASVSLDRILRVVPAEAPKQEEPAAKPKKAGGK